MKQSCVYQGQVVHQRHRPVKHRLSYRVYTMFLDLDELVDLDKNLSFFNHNRFGLFSLYDRDHGNGEARDLRAQVEAHMQSAGVTTGLASIKLLCYPRVLGYVFNPLSVFYCYDAEDHLVGIIYEVNNTHGERHSYVIPVQDDTENVSQSCDKKFFVSPFLPMDCHYQFHLNRPDTEMKLFIHETHDDEPILDAWVTGSRRELSGAYLLRLALGMPLQTLKVVLAIHWEALKLWRKKVPFLRHPQAPKYGASYINK